MIQVVDMDGASVRTSFLAPENSAETDMLEEAYTSAELRLASYFRIGSSILGFFSAPPLIANGERERFPPFRGQRVDGGERCKRPGGQRPAPHDTAEVRWCRTPGGRAASCWNPPHTRTLAMVQKAREPRAISPCACVGLRWPSARSFFPPLPPPLVLLQ